MATLNDRSLLTLTQQDIYFDQLHRPASPLYNVGGYIRFVEIDAARLFEAHAAVVNNNDVFGLRVLAQGEQVLQRISDQRTTELTCVDFSQQEDAARLAQAWLRKLFETPIQVENSELFKSYLVKVASAEFWYVGVAHHLMMDGFGFALWGKRLGQYYNGQTEDIPEPLAWQEIARRDQRYTASGKYQTDLEYWQSKCGDINGHTLNPVHLAEVADPHNAPSGREIKQLDTALYRALQQFCQDYQVGAPQVFLACIATYFRKAQSRSELLFGLPFHNRRGFSEKQMLGVFTSISPFRIGIDLKDSFIDLIKQVNSTQRSDFRHQRFPLGPLARALGYSGPDQRLYDIGFNYLLLDSDLQINGEAVDLVYVSHNHETTPLMVNIWEYGASQSIQLQLDYNQAYFNRAEAALLAQRINRLLADLVKHPERPLSGQSIVLGEEQEQLLKLSRAVRLNIPEVGLAQGFEAQAAEQPVATALVRGDAVWSYAELNRRANQVAHCLLQQGLQAGTRVGLCTSRSMHMVAGLLGILKAGGAYVPLDPAYPAARLADIMHDSELTVLLTESKIETLPDWQGLSVKLDDEQHLAGYVDTNPDLPAMPDAVAYLIYTSGSTGKPKGVEIRHRNAVAMVHWALHTFSRRALSRVLASTSLNFDLSVFELLVPLSGGGCCVLVDDALALLEQSPSVSLINTVPSAIKVLLEQAAIPAGVEVVNLAGEPLSREVVNGLLEGGHCERVLNLYGPSEDTTYSTYAEFTERLGGTPPIGRPIANTSGYVFSPEGELLPLGAVGELYLSGAGVAKGYLKRESLTAERFVHRQVAGREERMYRTGDLVRYRSDGELEYLGRSDDQVKIRGFRIELGEIESSLQAHAGVREAVVVAKTFADEQRLVAYVVAHPDTALERAELDSHLEQHLPYYMLPAALFVLAELPLTVNGKVDKQALLERTDNITATDGVLPQTAVEKTLAGLWKRALNLNGELSVNDNFFKVGGNSLTATKLLAKINREFGTQLSIADFFAHNTIKAGAEIVEAMADLHPVEIIKTDDSVELPLSFAQRQMWFIQQFDQTQSQYNMPVVIRLSGALQTAALQTALSEIVRRHSALRTSYIDDSGEPIQQINQSPGFELSIADWSALTEDRVALRQAVLTYAEEQAAEPFDLCTELLIRAKVLQAGSDESYLLLILHHIAADGWSLEILFAELAQIYNAIIAGKPTALAPVAYQYSDFARWQQHSAEQGQFEKDWHYWQSRLLDAPEIHTLATDFPRPPNQQFSGQLHRQLVEPVFYQSLETCAQQHEVTLFVLLHTALAVLIGQWSHHQDVVIGTPVAGRTRHEFDSTIGCFVNSIALRTQYTGQQHFSDLLGVNMADTVTALEHQAIPFEMLVQRLQHQRSLSFAPLIQIALSIQDISQDAFTLNGVSAEIETLSNPAAKYDLELRLVVNGDTAELHWIYPDSLFAANTIQRLSDSYRQLLESVIANPQVAIDELDMVPPDQLSQLLQWAELRQPYTADMNLQQLFEAQVERAPNAIALTAGAVQISYSELNRRANHLARYLHQQGVRRCDVIGVYLNRSEAFVTAVLAIVKLGAAYLPLDVRYPQRRLNYMLDDAGVKLVLGIAPLPDGLHASQYIDINDLPAGNVAGNPATICNADDMVYINYTSGSTGQPKGVQVCHRNVVRLVVNPDYVKLDAATVMLHVSSVAFDAATFEIWGSLLNGGRLVVYPDSAIDLTELNRIATVQQVNCTFVSSGLFDQWSRQLPEAGDLRQILVGGDVVSPKSVARAYRQLPKAVIKNLYGPTENTTFSTRFRIPKDWDEGLALPIGKAINGTTGYVLNSVGQPAPLGAVGELCLGGDGVSLGYLNQPALNRKKFIANPFNQQPDHTLYRTGDLVRYQADGNLAYVGRSDGMVKIRGFRIETGEIERRLCDLRDVSDALVCPRSDDNGKYLVAYVILRQLPDVSIQATESKRLLAELKAELPEFMLPAYWVFLDQFPLNHNGKVDKRALPAPDTQRLDELVAANTATELKLVKLWQRLLKTEPVGVTQSFFALGGHSLLATRLASLLSEQFEVAVSVRAVFEHDTVRNLASHIESLQITRFKPILRQAERNDTILSYAQQRLLFLHQLNDQGSEYHISGGVQLSGVVQPRLIEAALQRIITRHEVLRTNFVTRDGEAVLSLREPFAFELQEQDFSALPASAQPTALSEYAEQHSAQPFDLANDLMLRACLVRLDETRHVLLVSLHHIAADGWSLTNLVKEFCHFYTALLTGKKDHLGDPPVQYADFAVWQQEQNSSPDFAQTQRYWLQQLDDIPQVHSLPLDFPRPVEPDYRAGSLITQVDTNTGLALKQMAAEHGVTLFMLLHSAFALLVGRWSNANDVVIGSPVAGRTHPDIDDLIGLFVNTLALRSDLSENISFAELLMQGKQTALAAQTYQAMPFDRLVEELNTSRSLSHAPVFQIMFALQNNEAYEFAVPDLTIEPYSSPIKTLKFDLELNVEQHGDALELRWDYAKALFADATIQRLADSYLVLLAHALQDSQVRLNEIRLLAEQEQEHLLKLSRAVRLNIPEVGLAQGFEAQAAEQPVATALVRGDAVWSYAELNRRANQVAHCLLQQGLQAGTRVGLCTSRSMHMVAGLLGILKAGGAYVPLDPAYPAARLADIMHDSELTVLLTESKIKTLPDWQGLSVKLDDEQHLAGYADTNPDLPVMPDAVAYLIYTSGSTGKPKGVEIRHRNAVAMVHWALHTFSRRALSRVLASTSLNFDLSVFELLVPLSGGGCCVLVDDALALLEQSPSVSLINTVPSAIKVLLEQAAIPAGVEVVNLAGEPLSREVVNGLLEGGHCERVLNLYGPSEDTTYSTYAEFTERLGGTPPIGRPIANTSGYVFSPEGELLPLGAVGELYLSGAGVAKGYLKRESLTAERFVHRQVAGREERMYRTGDLVRYRSDGELEYLGRSDDQVKIRGFRIELGEIESSLQAHAGVREAVVVAKTFADEQRLVAYVVPKQIEELKSPGFAVQLTDQLKQTLPDFMVPGIFVPLARFPLTANGKIDKRRLPEPNFAETEFIAAANATEQALSEIWAELLDLPVDQVSTRANFFALGGHSLLSSRMIHLAKVRYDFELRVKDLFAAPTIAELARVIDHTASDYLPLQHQPTVVNTPLSYAQYRLWFIEQIKGKSTEFNLPLSLNLSGQVDPSVLQVALNRLIETHDMLRTHLTLPGGEPFQQVQAEYSLELKMIDLSDLPKQQRKSEIIALQTQQAKQLLDIYRLPLVTAVLIKSAEQTYMLNLNFHHIIFDGWSAVRFVNDLLQCYEDIARGTVPTLLKPQYTYRDFALWQDAFLDTGEARRQQRFWQNYLAGCNEELKLPFQYLKPVAPEYSEGLVRRVLDAERLSQLTQLAKQHQGTVFNLIHTALTLLLHRITGLNDFNIGIPVSGRNVPGTENIIGMFVNNLPLRNRLRSELSFSELLRQQIENGNAVLSNQDLPFEKILELAQSQRNPQSTPLFQVFLNMLNLPAGQQGNDYFNIALNRSVDVGNKFNLTFYVAPRDGELEITCSYNKALFTAASVKILCEQFVSLLEQLAAGDDLLLHEYSLRTRQCVDALPDPATPLDDYWQEPIIQQFGRAIERFPERIATSFSGRKLTYQELGSVVDLFAQRLVDAGVGRGDLVGIMTERSDSLPAVTLATLKLGAAFMLLSASAPGLRVVRNIEIARPKAVVSLQSVQTVQAEVRTALDEATIPIVPLTIAEDTARIAAATPIELPALEYPPDLPAYIAFTSGSTGTPKAIAGVQRSLVLFTPWAERVCGLSATDRFAMTSGLVHDPLHRDMFTPLVLGATLCIPTEAECQGPALAAWLHKHQISVLNLTPSLGQVIAADHEQTIKSLRFGFFVGEALTVQHLHNFRQVAPDMRAINLYGATETGRAVGYFAATADEAAYEHTAALPLGRGIDGAELIVLNQALQVCAIGEVGQVGIRSRHLSAGYANDSQLTAARFIRNPAGSDGEDIIYLTGDMGYYDQAGEVIGVGRQDDQIKVRGFRVELGEIQALLDEHPLIHQAVVIATRAQDDETVLVAYCVAADSVLDEDYLRTHLRSMLPDYMVPTHFVAVDHIPLTENGKLDRNQLLAVECIQQAKPRVAPETDLEQELFEIWTEVLKTDQLGVEDDFFSLGGHSILATQLMVRIRKRFACEVRYQDFYADNSIRGVARQIEQALALKTVLQKEEKKNRVVL